MRITLFARDRVLGSLPLLALLASLTPLAVSAAEPAPDAERRRFDLPAGPAPQTLAAFAEASGRQIVFLADTAREVVTPALAGVFTPRAALDRLIAGTGLTVVEDPGTSALLVARLTGKKDSGATTLPIPSQSPPQPKPSMKTKNPLAALGTWLALAFAPAALAADGTGTIAGRVSNAATGVYLEKARITVEGTTLETFTDEGGYYQLTQVPAGAAKVKAFFTGFPAQTSAVSVAAGKTAQHDIGLEAYPGRTRAGAAGGAIVSLDKFVVSTSKEMDGAAIAINEQRFAPNIVNVVAADEFGSMAEGNVAEFMKFLPGITMNVGESGDANTISINGVPSGNVPVTVGGFDLASANQYFGTGTGREVNMDQVSLNSIARIEVAYTPTPETTGSALAGSVNMVPRSAFERSKPVFNASAFIMMRDSEKTFKKTPGPGRNPSRKVHPGFDFSYIVPVNKRFGFTLSGGTSTNYTTEDIIVRDWRGNGVATTGLTAGTASQYPDTTPDRPYMSRFSFDVDTKVTKRASIGATIDYKLTENDTLSFSFQYANNNSMTNGRRLNFRLVRVAPGDFSPTSVTGTGNIVVQGGDYHFNGTTYMPGLTYRHNGPIWKAEAAVGVSHSTGHHRDGSKGFVNDASALRDNVRITFADINYLRPASIIVADAATGAPVNPYDLSNYVLDGAHGLERDGVDTKRSAYANVRRDFYGRVPVSLKAGFDVRQSLRDFTNWVTIRSFVGADGIRYTADDNAIVVLDESVSKRIPPYGFPPVQWIDTVDYYDLYRANPAHFAVNALSNYNNRTNASKFAAETISAAYLRGDLQFFDRRLKLVGGIRAEQTNIRAEGRLLDPTLNYARDAGGRVILEPNGSPRLIQPAGSLGAAQLTSIERGLKARKEYLRWFPSLNASFNLRDNLIARAGHYWSVGRPNFNQYAGALNLPDTERPPSAGNRISVANAGIKAWSATTTKLSLEYYFERVGLFSVGAFRRDFENFFGATVFPATSEFLALYSLDPNTYGDYEVTTQYNLSSRVRMQGLDFNYKQALTFLPNWARGVQVFANASAQRASGDAAANFSGYVPRTYSWGASLSRDKFKLRANYNYRGRARGSQITGRGIEAGTFNWSAKRLYLDLSGEYALGRQLALFANLRNVLDAGTDGERSGPSTPQHAQLGVREYWGSLWTFGVKGSF